MNEVVTIPRPDAVAASESIPINAIGQYLRVRFSPTKTQHLSIAEVEVMGYIIDEVPTAPVYQIRMVGVTLCFVIPLDIVWSRREP